MQEKVRIFADINASSVFIKANYGRHRFCHVDQDKHITFLDNSSGKEFNSKSKIQFYVASIFDFNSNVVSYKFFDKNK